MIYILLSQIWLFLLVTYFIHSPFVFPLNVYSREGNGTSLQYSCLENPMDRGAWKAAVHGVAEGRTRLSDFTFTFHFHALEKEMATHSSVLAWRIPGMGEPGGLPSMGSHRVGDDWSDLAAAAAAAANLHWMWELDHKESWAPKNWCFWTVVLKKILESPLDFKENKPVNPKGNQLWIFTGSTDAEAPVLW